MEVETQSLELTLLPIRHEFDDLGLVQAAAMNETLSDAVKRSRAWHDKLGLCEIRKFAVIDVDHVLVCKEVADP